MQLPIPLGGIAIKRSITADIAQQIDADIKKRIEFAFSNYPSLPLNVKQHSQEMSEDVMRQHIELYVNDYSLNMDNEGRYAIKTLFDVYNQMNNQPRITSDKLFLL